MLAVSGRVLHRYPPWYPTADRNSTAMASTCTIRRATTDIRTPTLRGKKVWIDLDNSPHVPFFAPIIEQLRIRGCTLLVTARDCFQVCELADLFDLEYRRIGRHYGKFRVLKLAGLGVRALQLAPAVLAEKPDLALSHGSRAQLLVSALARVPSVVIVDYEFARGLTLMKPGWVMVPEVIPDAAIRFDPSRILRYPGIKEDVYAPRFRPDPAIKPSLGLNGKDLVVTVRPPANEAHYHNPQSEELFAAVVDFLSHNPNVKVILLPRNRSQEICLRSSYPNLFATREIDHSGARSRWSKPHLAFRPCHQRRRHHESRGGRIGGSCLQHLSRKDWGGGSISGGYWPTSARGKC